MKKTLTLILTLMLLLTALPTLATAPDTSPFIIDVSAMSAEAQASWNSLFEMEDSQIWHGDMNHPDRMSKSTESTGFIEQGVKIRITGSEPVDLLIDNQLIFSTNLKREKNRMFLAYFVSPETSEEFTIVNTQKAANEDKYPVLDNRDNRYYYDEYQLWVANLLDPVKENNDQPYEAIDVYFQGEDKVLHHGLITVEFSDTDYKLVMKPVE